MTEGQVAERGGNCLFVMDRHRNTAGVQERKGGRLREEIRSLNCSHLTHVREQHATKLFVKREVVAKSISGGCGRRGGTMADSGHAVDDQRGQVPITQALAGRNPASRLTV